MIGAIDRRPVAAAAPPARGSCSSRLLAAPWFVNDYLLTVLILILLFRLCRPGLEHHDGLCRAAVARARDLYRSRRLCRGDLVYPLRRQSLARFARRLFRLPRPAARSSAFSPFVFGVAGVYFAILTIAFAEFARIGFDHLDFVNASGGLFLPVKQYAHNDLWQLRGDPRMFYYVILAATALVFVLCHLLIRSRVGYFWLAIREDEQAARATGIDTFRYKMYAVMVSAGGDLVCRRVLRVFLQQSFSRAGVQHFALDRDHSRSGHRRRRHAVRSDPWRIRADRPRRGPQLGDDCIRHRSAGGDAGVLWHVPSARGRGAAGRRLAAAGAAAWREDGARNDRAARRSTPSANASVASSRSIRSVLPCRRARFSP